MNNEKIFDKVFVGGGKTIRDFYGRTLGTYNAATDTTRDFYGRTVAKGECLTMLIEK